MKITYDGKADAAYVYIEDPIAAGASVKTHLYTKNPYGLIVLDFDREDRLLGVEVLNASKVLTEKTLATAARIDHPHREEAP